MTTRKQICEAVGNLITSDRNNTHGDPHVQFTLAQKLKDLMRSSHRWSELTYSEREAIETICTKLSRIGTGSSFLDHYMDIIGYSAIAGEDVTPGANLPKVKRK